MPRCLALVCALLALVCCGADMPIPPDHQMVSAADAGPGAPFTEIECPSDDASVAAADIRRVAAVCLANDADHQSQIDTKVDRAGDTMTGTLTINPSGPTIGLDVSAGASSNARAALFIADGTAEGIRAEGGATGGGATFAAGGGNNYGVRGLAAGTGTGVIGIGDAGGLGGQFTAGTGNQHGLIGIGSGTFAGGSFQGGATGPGVLAVNGTASTAAAPTEAMRSAGYLRFIHADPTNSTVDPGANNVLHGANITKSWVTIDDTYAILDGYNVASITNVLGDIYALTFVRPMANANYGVKIHVHGAIGFSGAHNGTKTTTGFQFVLFKTDTLATGFGTASEAYIEVTGRQ